MEEVSFSFEVLWLIKERGEEFAHKCILNVTQLKPYQFTEYPTQLINWIKTVDKLPVPMDMEMRQKRMHDRIFNFFAFHEYRKHLPVHPYQTRRQAAMLEVIEEFLSQADIQIRNMIFDLC